MDKANKTRKIEEINAKLKEQYKDVADKTVEELGISKEIALEFYNKVLTLLDKLGCSDKREKPVSRKVLAAMGIPEDVANQFLRLCEYHGGICDCKLCMYAGEVLKYEPTE